MNRKLLLAALALLLPHPAQAQSLCPGSVLLREAPETAGVSVRQGINTNGRISNHEWDHNWLNVEAICRGDIRAEDWGTALADGCLLEASGGQVTCGSGGSGGGSGPAVAVWSVCHTGCDYSSIGTAVEAVKLLPAPVDPTFGQPLRKVISVRNGLYSETPFDVGELALVGEANGMSALDISQWPGPRIVFTTPDSGAFITLGKGAALANLGIQFAPLPTGPASIIRVEGGTPSSYVSIVNVAVVSVISGTLTAGNPVIHLEHTGAGGAFQYLTMKDVLLQPFASGGSEHLTLFHGSGGTLNYLWDSWVSPNGRSNGYGLRLTGTGTKLGLYNVKLTEGTGLPGTWANDEVSVDPGNWVYSQATPISSVSDGWIRALDRSGGEQSLSVADDSTAASVATGTAEPWQGTLSVTCSDPDGCELNLAANSAVPGQRVALVALSGTLRLAGETELCTSIEVVYAGGSWRRIHGEGCS